MSDKENCNCGSNPCCDECEPVNCIEQAVNDVWATKETQIEGLVQKAEDAADRSEDAASAAAGSASEAKGYRDEAEQAAITAVAAEGTVIEVAGILQETGEALRRVASQLEDAIAGITVVPFYYTIETNQQTVIVLPAEIKTASVQAIYIDGLRQESGVDRGFTYVALTRTITLASGLPKGLEIVIMLGTYNADNPDDFSHTLASTNGASLIGTTGGATVQEVLNSIKPYIQVGTFAAGGAVSDEYDTFFSHTDIYGNDYWWAYIGPLPYPVPVLPGTSPDSNWMLVISDTFKAPLSPELPIVNISSVGEASTTYNVADTSTFVVGNYAFIYSTVRDGQWYGGVFKVLSKTSTTIELQQSNAKITATGPTLLGACNVRAMNFIVNSPGGVTVNGFVRSVEGILFNGAGTASYGLRLGGGHNNTGILRNSASIGSLRHCAFVNMRRSGATSDDVVGILIAAGSSLGVQNVAVNGTKIGIETYRNGSLIGTGAYVYDASNDAFKAEFTCNNYLYYCAAIKCGTGFSARYNAGGEYATIVCCNAVYGALAQFEGYCSVRNFNFYGMTSAGVYSTDGGYMLVAGTSEIDTCNRTYRCFQGATIEQIANTIITERNCAGGYNVNSASLRLLVRTVVSGGPDTWDGEGEVIINGVDQSLVAYTASATISANGRAAWQVIFPFTFDESGARKVKFGIRYSDSALPAGVIVPFPAYYNSSSCRIYFYNLTAAPIVLNASVYAYVTS